MKTKNLLFLHIYNDMLSIYMYHHMHILHLVFASFGMTLKIDHRLRQIWARVQNL